MPQPEEFPGVDLGMLAVDLAGTLSRYEYPIDICDEDIAANLPGFLTACLATANGALAGTAPSAPRTVQVEVRNNYGTDAVYPACDTGRAFAKLTRKKTFSDVDLNVIRMLGYEITIAQESTGLPTGFGHATVI